MRFLLLILMSFCAFAVEPDIHLPTGKELPGWAKDLPKKQEAAWGDTAPWRKLEKKHDKENAFATMRHKAEEEYKQAYEAALDNFAKTANLTKLPNYPAGSDDASDYRTGLELLKRRKAPGWKDLTGEQWNSMDDFFITYAKLNNEPLALAFLFGESNRAKYCR